jgi:hypothetical protein
MGIGVSVMEHPISTPKNFNQTLKGRLTPGSTRTPPALPSALSQHFAISASLSASAQAVPVSPVR